MKKITYVCPSCGAREEEAEGAPVPSCCGLPMEVEALPGCTSAATAEMDRPGRADEPCDDGTGAKPKR